MRTSPNDSGDSNESRDPADRENPLRLQPIGVFEGDRLYKYEAPRQGVYAPPGDPGRGLVRLRDRCDFEQALVELNGFERIWLLFGFHESPPVDPAHRWKPMVRPPTSPAKIGVFATRAPHRPNGLGLSCVRLEQVDGLTLHVSEADLLHGSPIYDIKPYVPAYDAHPRARAGWTEREPEGPGYDIRYSPEARERIAFLKAGGVDLERFIELQLRHSPTDTGRKRVSRVARPADPEALEYTLAYRTWRVGFRLTATAAKAATPGEDSAALEVFTIASGYGSDVLAADLDSYGDLELHRSFCDRFGS